MDLIIQIGIVVIAIAFIILMYAVIQTLKVLRAAIEELRLMIGQVREDVSHISDDMKEAIHNTNAMTQDMRSKLSALNIVFTTINDIGQALHSFTGIAKQSAASIAANIKKDSSETATRIQKKKVRATTTRDGLTTSLIDGLASTLRIWKKIKQL